MSDVGGPLLFHSMEPWPEREPIVEVMHGGTIYDLHNWGSFRGFEYLMPDRLVLKFQHDGTMGGRQSGSPAEDIELRFSGLANLTVDEADLVARYEAETLSEIVYQVWQGRGELEVVFMNGFRLRFSAGSVEFSRPGT